MERLRPAPTPAPAPAPELEGAREQGRRSGPPRLSGWALGLLALVLGAACASDDGPGPLSEGEHEAIRERAHEDQDDLDRVMGEEESPERDAAP